MNTKSTKDQAPIAARVADLSQARREFLKMLLEQEGVDASRLPIVPQSDLNTAPLSFAQQRLWFLQKLQPENSTYNIPTALRLHGRLNVLALEKSLNEIIKRHEALRTTFNVIDKQLRQVIAPVLNVKLKVSEIGGLPEAEREREIRSLTRDEAQAPFDLTHGPLLRASLLRLGEQEHVLLLSMHHIVCDGWSMGVLIREMAALYEAFVSGEDSPLEELPIQYADFARWQREWLSDDVLESQLTYWKQSLADHAPVLELPTDYARASAKTLRAEVETFELSRSLSDALKQLSRRESATLFMILLAAFKTLLYWHTGEEDILLGTPVSGRTQMGTEKLIGCFINTLVLRTAVNGALSFRELLARVREVSLAAYAHQDLPFEKLVEELQPERDANRTPLFRLMFVMQNAAPEEVEIQGLSFKLAQADNGLMQFDFILSMAEEAGVLIGAMGYQRDLFHRSTITRLASHFKTLLQSIVADPDEKLANLHVLTESERGGSNASDFPDTGMSQMEFENLILEINEGTD